MKNLKKNNKGFSLVELIVVVLIMAIIAVALAPQIMKWVKNSRITADQNACGNIKAAVQAGIASFQQRGGSLWAADETKTAKINGVKLSTKTNYTSNEVKLDDWIDEALGDESYKTKYDDGGFTISITGKGGVTVTCGASTISLD